MMGAQFCVAAETVRGLKGLVHPILRAEGVPGLMRLLGFDRSLALDGLIAVFFEKL